MWCRCVRDSHLLLGRRSVAYVGHVGCPGCLSSLTSAGRLWSYQEKHGPISVCAAAEKQPLQICGASALISHRYLPLFRWSLGLRLLSVGLSVSVSVVSVTFPFLSSVKTKKKKNPVYVSHTERKHTSCFLLSAHQTADTIITNITLFHHFLCSMFIFLLFYNQFVSQSLSFLYPIFAFISFGKNSGMEACCCQNQ